MPVPEILFPAGESLDDDNSCNYFEGIFADHGCAVSPSCLTCPLVVCKHDDPSVTQRESRRVLEEQRAKFYWDTVATDGPAVAMARMIEVYGVTERTVYRILKRVR